MSITHVEARRLIQFDMDRALDLDDKVLLAAHLRECSACRSYAEEIRDVTRILAPLMRRQWSRRPLPLSPTALTGKAKPARRAKTLVAMRTAFIGIMFLAFAVSAWQFMLASAGDPLNAPASAVPVSTPSLPSTTTGTGWENCEMILYTVQPNDTLARIARQFSAATEEILIANKLESETLRSGMQLRIPSCSSTPTSTLEGPVLWPTTYTPLFDPTTTTPGPGG
jgi:hypothetical protein